MMKRPRKEPFTDENGNRHSRLRDLVYRVFHFLCVCRCIACAEIIGEDAVFCSECAEEFEAALLSECGLCGRSLCNCLCADTSLDRTGIHRHVKLYRYLSDDPDAVGNRVLYRLKRNDVATCFRFLGGKLAERVRTLIAPDESYVVSFIPRAPKRVSEHGFDQSARIAKEMSIALGLPFLRPLKRGHRAKTQKSLSSVAERGKNAASSLFLRKGAENIIRGKRVLLFDDIVTSGASMRAAAKLLRRCGAKEVIAVSIAVVTHTRNLRIEAEQNSRLPFYMR
jgi:ComF family protein